MFAAWTTMHSPPGPSRGETGEAGDVGENVCLGTAGNNGARRSQRGAVAAAVCVVRQRIVSQRVLEFGHGGRIVRVAIRSLRLPAMSKEAGRVLPTSGRPEAGGWVGTAGKAGSGRGLYIDSPMPVADLVEFDFLCRRPPFLPPPPPPPSIPPLPPAIRLAWLANSRRCIAPDGGPIYEPPPAPWPALPRIAVSTGARGWAGGRVEAAPGREGGGMRRGGREGGCASGWSGRLGLQLASNRQESQDPPIILGTLFVPTLLPAAALPECPARAKTARKRQRSGGVCIARSRLLRFRLVRDQRRRRHKRDGSHRGGCLSRAGVTLPIRSRRRPPLPLAAWSHAGLLRGAPSVAAGQGVAIGGSGASAMLPSQRGRR